MDNRSNANCYIQVFNKIDELLQRDDKQLIIAIDGMCGSGKSSLADLLARNYECNVFHMDNYFLPFEMRTKERLKELGGNVHYERFKSEILNPLKENRTVTSRAYLCSDGITSEQGIVEPRRLNIVEGSYSLHPYLRDAYDFSIFLEIEDKEQIKRIVLRDPERSIQPFVDIWIPLENKYFNELSIKSICDIVLDTTNFDMIY